MCICTFPSDCGGLGVVFCDGCGGDLCVCPCGGERECDCDMCGVGNGDNDDYPDGVELIDGYDCTCTEVLVVNGTTKTYCETIGQLAAALGRSCCSLSTHGPDFCLCGVDLEALGARAATDAEGCPHPAFVIEVSEDTTP